MTKDELRREMRRRLRLLENRAEKSHALATAVAQHPAFVRSQRVAIFAPLASEPDVELLWGKGTAAFCYPRVAGSEMDFCAVGARGELLVAPWHAGVREPAPTVPAVAPESIDLILVPGLAFTAQGSRLGRGGGFYDRYLALLPASTTRLGVCFETQIVPALPTEAHDHPMHGVITERGLLVA